MSLALQSDISVSRESGRSNAKSVSIRKVIFSSSFTAEEIGWGESNHRISVSRESRRASPVRSSRLCLKRSWQSDSSLTGYISDSRRGLLSRSDDPGGKSRSMVPDPAASWKKGQTAGAADAVLIKIEISRFFQNGMYLIETAFSGKVGNIKG